jgi:ATP-dependent exoDNAse (exonuclease V) beta subunit
VSTEKNNKPKKAKKTTEEIRAELDETGIDFTKLGLGPWSHSKMKVLKNCPLKFYLQYILKVPPTNPAEISLVTEVGKAAHRVLELYLGGKKLDASFKTTREEFIQTINDEEWKAQIEGVEYNIVRFKERVDALEQEHGVKRILQELRIGVTKEWEPTGFFSDDVYYRGIIDLVIQLKNSDCVIVDHKYGTNPAMGLRNFKDQLNTYKVLFHKGIDKITGAQAGIHHIKEGEVVLDEYADQNQIENELLNLMEYSIQGGIDALMEIGYFKHIAGNACKYCDYRVGCKEGLLKQTEKESKKWFEIKKIG